MTQTAAHTAAPTAGTTAARTARGVVVGYDGSPSASLALAWATTEAVRRGVPLTVLHAADY